MRAAPFAGPRGPLEHFRKGEGASRILLVHGAWHDARCWNVGGDGAPGFMDALAARGHEVHAVSLSGHGGSAGDLRRSRIAHYVDDVRACLDELGPGTTLVGHSMGGWVVSTILAQDATPRRAVLLAPVPANGMATTLPRLVAHDPVAALRSNINLDLSYMVSDEARVRSLFLSAATRTEAVSALKETLGNESFPAYLDMVAGRVPTPKAKVHDVLAIAALGNALFTPAQVAAHARLHGGAFAVVGTGGHDAMADVGRHEVCALVAAWASGRGETGETRLRA